LDSTAGKKEAGATVAVGGTAGLHGGRVTGDQPEWRFGVLKLAVRSQGGVGGMAKPVVMSTRHWKAGGELTMAWSGRHEASGEKGRRAGEGWLRCGMLRGGGALL
jgi:hypothetical protein